MTPSTRRTRQLCIARYPEGAPMPEDFCLQQVELPPLADGQIALAVATLSIDPYLRPLLAGRYATPRPPLGSCMPGMGLAEVIESRAPALPVGALVVADCGWAELAHVDAREVRVVDPAIRPARLHLGAFGLPGLTAWAGLRVIAPPRAGQTVLISAAAGAVGGVAGQLARWSGARTVGIVGSAAKQQLCVQRYGFDRAVNYRDPTFLEALSAACPEGVDIYFDNVGGPILEAALAGLNRAAQVVLCGLIDQYNSAQRPPGPNLGPVIAARASLHGLVVHDHWPRLPELHAELLPRWQRGELVIVEDIVEGLEQAPAAFCAMLRGDNLGKTLVQLTQDSGR